MASKTSIGAALKEFIEDIRIPYAIISDYSKESNGSNK
jgi:hypothetical protein